MREPPRGVDPAHLATVLRERWGLVGSLHHLPVGFGSHHWRLAPGSGGDAGSGSGDEPAVFVTVDELGHRPFLGPDAEGALAALVMAAAAVHALSAGGLDQAVAPLPSAEGSLVVALDADHAVWVHPWVTGTSGDFGEHLDDRRRTALLDVLAQLHATVVRVPLRRAPLFAERAQLLRLLDVSTRADDVEDHWPALAHQWLREHREELLAAVMALAEAEQRAASGDAVVTHGEPHPGNVMWTADGLRLIDWDTVALAPRERDVWLAATDDGDVEQYERASGARLDRRLLQAYDDAWQLSDAASYADELVRAVDRREDDADLVLAWRILQDWSAR